MQIALNRELDQIERYMTVLASVGSTAPFVGLFGTVWGIMNSFTAIAVTKNTSLAVCRTRDRGSPVRHGPRTRSQRSRR